MEYSYWGPSRYTVCCPEVIVPISGQAAKRNSIKHSPFLAGYLCGGSLSSCAGECWSFINYSRYNKVLQCSHIYTPYVLALLLFLWRLEIEIHGLMNNFRSWAQRWHIWGISEEYQVPWLYSYVKTYEAHQTCTLRKKVCLSTFFGSSDCHK